MSHFTYHVPHVKCQVSGVTCHVLDELVKLVHGGSVFLVLLLLFFFYQFVLFFTKFDISVNLKLVAWLF